MKELIIGLNDNTKELANLIRKDNESIGYINFVESYDYAINLKESDKNSFAYLVVDYNNPLEVSIANDLINILVLYYSMFVITIACNTTNIVDNVCFRSKAITYIEKVNRLNDDRIINDINTISTIISDKNTIKFNIYDIVNIARNVRKDFRIINVSSKDGFANLEKEMGESKNFIFYVEANNLFEIFDLDSTFDLLHLKHKDDTNIIFCSRTLPEEIEYINIKMLAF